MTFVVTDAIAIAKSLDVDTIIKKADKALGSTRLGTRKIVITLRDGELVTNEWVARRAHKNFPDGKRDLMVFLKPEDLKGNAYMYWKPDNKPVIEWVYLIPTRRVRKLFVIDTYGSFFGTDFTFADIGIKDPGGTYKLLGEEKYNEKDVYKLETVPNEKIYYSRIVSFINKDTFLPIKKDYYDAAGKHWKSKILENITVINNIPIPLKVRMIDVQRNHSTEVTFSEICSDVDYLTKEDFDPEKLPEAAFSPVCKVPTPKKK
jgi:hypothetical protein